ncbi:hypothetical protein [Runella slithyformis]|uniref:Uncharacterized protein n=1 Tax=Runella slithyformis (strain ATCC 29530 / DSM 19594 / LMG 11500 / NCIMB 11436 / LSU 4) TaxID=761193 RepID=A0A7U4E969_RUNSL|nr:hypothetical protein [Runella slithyformis]AEI52123.1 hypothetical protein Runsl_5826 [Runella slithyformis DSM 19594]
MQQIKPQNSGETASFSKAEVETMFWQNRAEALSAGQEKDNTKAVNEEKFEKGQQTVIISSLEEKIVQVINDKK